MRQTDIRRYAMHTIKSASGFLHRVYKIMPAINHLNTVRQQEIQLVLLILLHSHTIF